MELGPNQERWLKALEDAEFQQCFKNWERGEKVCAMAVAERVLGLFQGHWKNLGMKESAVDLIIKYNDEQRLSFPSIAKKIRANLDKFFSRSV